MWTTIKVDEPPAERSHAAELVLGLLLMAPIVLAPNAAAATLSYGQRSYIQQRSVTRGLDALRDADSAIRKDSDRVRQPYPPRFYGDVSRGIKGCRWLMERAIETNSRNWVQRYRACTQ